MTATNKRMLMVARDQARADHWQSLLVSQGWTVEILAYGTQLPDNYSQRFDVVLIAPGGTDTEQVISLIEKNQQSDNQIILPVLDNSTPQDIVKLIRLGIVDVLLTPFSDHEFIETVNRVDNYRNIYLENLSYSDRLEKTNKDLQDSLNILRMDQIAGRQVQKNLLPKTPLVHGNYTLNYRIIPSLYLSGDFVGYNVVLDRYLLFYLADVSGHGASSAFVTILLRFLLKRIVRRHTFDNDLKALARAPEGFMEHVNRHLIATGLEKHLTMFAGAIDMQSNMLRYSVASQMPMPVFNVKGDARYLPGRGKPIGMFEDATWNVEEIHLPEEFGLVVTSDGLFETFESKTLAEKENYLLDVTQQTDADFSKMCDRFRLDALKDVRDDISLLSIVRKA